MRPLDISYQAWRAQDAAALRAFRDGRPLPRDVEERRIAYASGAFLPTLIDRGNWAWVRASLDSFHGEAVVEAAPLHNVLEAVLHLSSRAPTARLRVVLKSSDGGPVSDFGICLRQIRLGEPTIWDMKPEPTDRGPVYRAAPGRYLSEVSPKARNADLDFGCFAKFEQEVELHAHTETVLEKTVEAGGLIRFTVHLSDSAEHRCIEDFTIGTTPGGQWVPGRLNFVKKLPDGWEMDSRVVAGEPRLWDTLLPPGHQELTVRSRDYADAVTSVTIEPRKVTDVDICLQAR